MTRRYVYCNNWMPVPNEPNMPITEVEARSQFDGGEQKTLSPGFVVAALSGKRSQPDYTLSVWPHAEKVRFTNFTPGGSPFSLISMETPSNGEPGSLRIRGITQYIYAPSQLNSLLSLGSAERTVSYTFFENGSGRIRVNSGEGDLSGETSNFSNFDVSELILDPGVSFANWDDFADRLISVDVAILPDSRKLGILPVLSHSVDGTT